MCDPISMVGLAISAASTVVSYQNQQAAYDQNKQNAAVAFKNSQDQLSARQSQEQAAASENKFEAGLDAQKAKATAAVAAGEAGVSGISVDALSHDIDARAGRYDANVDQNLDWTVQQLQQEKVGQASQYVDRVNSVQAPSFADAGLRIASAGLGSYSSYTKRTGNNPLNSIF